jgi:hypothetical protein
MRPMNVEPSLDDLLDDPIVRLRMKRARLRPESVRACLVETKRRLQDRDRREHFWRGLVGDQPAEC